MNEERLLNTLLAPHISEKAAVMGTGEHRKYIFKVTKDATKPQIKKAVEQLFKVEVHSVCVCNVKSKLARFRKTIGKHKAWKKAYVSLQKGQEIDVAGVNS